MRRLIARVAIYLYAQTFNATGYGRAVRGRVTPPKRQDRTMPTEDLAKLRNDFQAAYGRLCLLTCQALRAGEDRAKVHQAFNGNVLSPFTKIVKAYQGCHAALQAAQPCGETAIVETAHMTRRAVEGEWMVEIDARAGVGGA